MDDNVSHHVQLGINTTTKSLDLTNTNYAMDITLAMGWSRGPQHGMCQVSNYVVVRLIWKVGAIVCDNVPPHTQS